MPGKTTFSLAMKSLLMFALYVPICSLGQAQGSSSPASTQQTSSILKGTWTGTFFSSQTFAPFTLTLVITPNSQGHLTGDSSLDSECLKDAKFEVTVQGSTVVLAGSDKDGDNLTVRGEVDGSGAVMNVSYTLNASATGRCETDNGTGTLAKR